MRNAIVAISAVAILCAIVGCSTTTGAFNGAVKDFSAVVDTGKGIISTVYDPTNGTKVEYVLPAKVYTPTTEK